MWASDILWISLCVWVCVSPVLTHKLTSLQNTFQHSFTGWRLVSKQSVFVSMQAWECTVYYLMHTGALILFWLLKYVYVWLFWKCDEWMHVAFSLSVCESLNFQWTTQRPLRDLPCVHWFGCWLWKNNACQKAGSNSHQWNTIMYAAFAWCK